MLGRLFRRDHAAAVAKDVAKLLADEQKMDADMRRFFWHVHTRGFLEQIIPTYDRILGNHEFYRYARELGERGIGEKEAVERAMVEFARLAEVVERINPDELAGDHPDCFRCLVYSRIKSYAAAGAKMTFTEEWRVYEEILSGRGLSPKW